MNETLKLNGMEDSQFLALLPKLSRFHVVGSGQFSKWCYYFKYRKGAQALSWRGTAESPFKLDKSNNKLSPAMQEYPA